MTNIHSQSTPSLATYDDFIFESFIAPIRSLTVVDDEYPTLDKLIEFTLAPEQTESPWNETDLEQLRSFISLCRSENYSWSIDVYDGKPPSPTPNTQNSDDGDRVFLQHLNQSDLLILDYHLNGTDDGGTRCCKIIQELNNNDHFNLIIVHTNEAHDETGRRKVFNDILKSVTGRLPLPNIDEKREELDNHFSSITSPNYDFYELFAKLLSNLDINRTQTPDYFYNTIFKADSPFYSLKNETEEIIQQCTAQNITRDDLSLYLLDQQLEYHFPDQNNQNNYSSYTKAKFTSDFNWIATGRVFITVTPKSEHDKIEIIDKLKETLVDYKPSPLLLLMARIRFELDKVGIEIANQVHHDYRLQAGWLYNLVNQNIPPSYFKCEKAVNLHWEQLSESTKSSLVLFTQQMTTVLRTIPETEPKDIVRAFFSDNLISKKREILSRLNAYNCSKPVTSEQLTTGHIFRLSKSNKSELWICLTPACDMVARSSRTKEKWADRLGGLIPFKAVRITVIKEENVDSAIKKINQNNHIALYLDGETKWFSYLSDLSANPDWELMIAHDTKIRKENGLHTLKSITRLQNNDYNHDTLHYKALRSYTFDKIEVVAELRYEYALNLLQKLGANQSRVGLDFVNELWN